MYGCYGIKCSFVTKFSIYGNYDEQNFTIAINHNQSSQFYKPHINQYSNMQRQSRQCTHAGSRYPTNPSKLSHELHDLLSQAHNKLHNKSIKAILAPHGSLSQSGLTAAHAYKYLTHSNHFERVFIFGPFHCKFIEGCTLTYMEELQTPLGSLQVDRAVVNELKQTQGFHLIDIDKDEEQHSIEMQLPYIYKIFGKKAKIVPILTGSYSCSQLQRYVEVLLPYFEDPNTLFIFSTNFCHSSEALDTLHKPKSHSQRLEEISKVDHEGMRLIESHNFKQFKEYIHRSIHAICGRDSLYIFLALLQRSRLKLATRFVKYVQIEENLLESDHLNSYASAVTFIEEY